ncbi:MAG: hypothetical protein ACWA6U_06570 [Breznakibacter sp.]
MKYLLFLLALVLFMHTCRTVENIENRRKKVLADLEKDSTCMMFGEEKDSSGQELTMNPPSVPYSNLSVDYLPRNSRFVLHQ